MRDARAAVAGAGRRARSGPRRRGRTRSQALGFVGAIVIAPLILASLRRDARVLRPLRRRFWAALVALALLVVVAQLARGRSLSDLLGAYSVVGEGGYDVGEVLRFWLWHVEELTLYVAVVPVVVARRARSRSARRLPAGAGAPRRDASRSSPPRPSSSAPSPLGSRPTACRTGTCSSSRRSSSWPCSAWVELGAPRPRVPLVVGSVVALGARRRVPVPRFIGEPAKSDTFGLIPLWTANEHLLAGSLLA